MKQLDHLSPTAISLWYENREEFFKRYLAENHLPSLPQTQPMSVGSSFDAHIKSKLASMYLDSPSQFKFTTIFESQVEAQNRDFALDAGKRIFDQYVSTGAFKMLCNLIDLAVEPPKMEFKITKTFAAKNPTIGVFDPESIKFINLMGIPDLHLKLKENEVIFDWKVNGYLAKSKTYPKKNYSYCTATSNPHKDAQLFLKDGVPVDYTLNLEDVDKSWATQLSIYAWLLDLPVGSQFIAAIDQLCINDVTADYMNVNVAMHRHVVSEAFQLSIYNEIHNIYNSVNSGHVFCDLSREENDARIDQLEEECYALMQPGNDVLRMLIGRK